jgi:hypothetical protein
VYTLLCTLQNIQNPAAVPPAGIISCLTFNPLEPDLLAAGSYSRCIGLFDERTREQLMWLQGHAGGVTQVGPPASAAACMPYGLPAWVPPIAQCAAFSADTAYTGKCRVYRQAAFGERVCA